MYTRHSMYRGTFERETALYEHCSSVGIAVQLNCVCFFAVTNGEPCYPLNTVFCVCLKKEAFRDILTFITLCLHSFPPRQMHRCKYLAVALTKDALQVTAVCCTFFSKDDSQYLSAPVLSSSVTPFLLSATPSVIPHCELALGGMDAKSTEAKEPWEQSAFKPQGSSSSSAFLM